MIDKGTVVYFLRRTTVLVLLIAVAGSVTPQVAIPAKAQEGESLEDPYSDRSPDQVYTERAEGSLQVGLGEADITPTWPVQLPYGAESKTTDSYGETKVKVFLLEVSGKKFAIIGYDLIGIDKNDTHYIKNEIDESTDIEKENIVLSATHNHSYPRVGEPKVRQYIAKKSVEAVRGATEGMFEGRIGISEKDVREDISLNRAEINGVSNTSLYVIKIEDSEGNLRGIHYNFGVHPTIFTEWGGAQGKIGPEWPGYVNMYIKMRKKLDLAYRKYEDKGDHEVEPWVMFSQGAAGDQEPRRSDVKILGNREEASKVFAEKLAWEVIDLTEKTDTRDSVKVEMRSKTMDLRRSNGEEYRTLLQSMSINNSLIATIPGELNVGLARDFVETSPFQNNILVTIAGDYIGYIVQDHLAWEKVTYQAKSIGFEPHYGERIIDESLKLVDSSYQVRAKRDPDSFLGSISGTVDYDGDHTVAVGVKRMPSGPNYAGGFWGRRTVVDRDGSWEIDSLSSGQLYIYIVETDRENPRPSEFKSSFEDIRDLVIGYPVSIKPQEDKNDINFTIDEEYMREGVESISFDDSSLRADGYSLNGRVSTKGELDEKEEIIVGIYPAKLSYRSQITYIRNPILETNVDSNGEFSFGSLMPGKYRVVAYMDLNGNGIKETIDMYTNPQESPVVVIGNSVNDGSVDSPRREKSQVLY